MANEHLNDLPRIHPRHCVVAQAGIELETYALGLVDRHNLTYAECMMLVGELVHRLSEPIISAERSSTAEQPHTAAAVDL